MLEIEIIETDIIDGGIQVFARAWKDGVQIGFGKDGTVDVERFRVINPPVLVEDPMGSIVESNFVEVTGETVITLFKEDPEEALLQSLEQSIRLVGKDGSNIIEGKVGNTTTTIYATVDVRQRAESNNNLTWSQTRDLTASDSQDLNSSTDAGPYLEWDPGAATNKVRLIRYFSNFDTSAIGTDTVDSAIYSVYVNATPWDQWNDADSYATVIEQASASDTTFITTDFDSIYNADDTTPLVGTKNMKELCDSGQRRDFTTATIGFHDYTLNATGESAVNGAGYTKLGLAIGKDVDDRDAAPASYKLEGLQYRGVGYTGTASDPKLVVEHSAAAGPTQNSNFLMYM